MLTPPIPTRPRDNIPVSQEMDEALQKAANPVPVPVNVTQWAINPEASKKLDSLIAARKALAVSALEKVIFQPVNPFQDIPKPALFSLFAPEIKTYSALKTSREIIIPSPTQLTQLNEAGETLISAADYYTSTPDSASLKAYQSAFNDIKTELDTFKKAIDLVQSTLEKKIRLNAGEHVMEAYQSTFEKYKANLDRHERTLSDLALKSTANTEEPS
jgi:hypothetical protein